MCHITGTKLLVIKMPNANCWVVILIIIYSVPLDIDECLTGNFSCNEVGEECENIPGSYRCECSERLNMVRVNGTCICKYPAKAVVGGFTLFIRYITLTREVHTTKDANQSINQSSINFNVLDEGCLRLLNKTTWKLRFNLVSPGGFLSSWPPQLF